MRTHVSVLVYHVCKKKAKELLRTDHGLNWRAPQYTHRMRRETWETIPPDILCGFLPRVSMIVEMTVVKLCADLDGRGSHIVILPPKKGVSHGEYRSVGSCSESAEMDAEAILARIFAQDA